MSSLSAFAAHARAMATAEHKPECKGTPEMVAARAKRAIDYRRLFREDHPKLAPVEPCAGCVTDADRALWARLADEAEAYLSRHEEASLL